MANIEATRQAGSVRSPSSSRSSLSIDRVAAPTNVRRNRAALRDYYGLASAAPTNVNGPTVEDSVPSSELDKEDFKSTTYVDTLLQTEGLETLLRVEAGLVNDIRGIDGERKALVYDNYSKLIAATETIRKMRTNMDPMTPMTNTLSPAISHIAETAVSLSSTMKQRVEALASRDSTSSQANPEDEVKGDKKETVRWALDAPRRYRAMLLEGKSEEAHADFSTLSALLDKWNGVPGVEELRAQSQAALND